MKRFLIKGAIVTCIFLLAGLCSIAVTSNDKSLKQQGAAGDDYRVEEDNKAYSAVMSEEIIEQATAEDIEFQCRTDDNIIIKGAIRLPEDYHKNIKYPVAVLSSGILGDRNQGGLFSALACYLEKNQIISVRFDFDGYGESGGELVDNSLKSECKDLKAVIKYVKTLSYVNTKQINLVGFSMGGAVSSLVAGELKDDIHSMALWAPAAVIVDDCAQGRLLDTTVDVNNLGSEIPVMDGEFTFGRAFFEDAIGLDIYGIAKNYTGPVLILQGNKDATVPMKYSEKYNQIYNDSQLQIIDNGEHVFTGKALQSAILLTTEFLKEKN